ncbi:hypothetical protein ACFV0C_36970 [Streptomyces sp. NPDC059568]|uniref:hypothetical protein n=1 Tax=Streptomyces sp. NPDC059568 TaxID=3346868 RepID=UPI0036945C30
MFYDQLTRAATDHPWYALAAALALLAVLALATVFVTRRFSVPVTVAAVGALVCTIYTADTSWRFAEHRLGMTDSSERLVMFAAAELALLACAVMARANKKATASDTAAGRAGIPGVLVWVITGVQVIPAYSESGIVGGTVRAVIGPVMAGLLWHLAMGLEIRIARPTALSTGLAAMVGRELHQRLLSYLGLATRDRTAEQISRDRATARAVRLASRTTLRTPWGRHRLAAAVARSGAALDPEQHDRLMHQLAARRTADQLATITIASPWRAPEYETAVERVSVPEDIPPVLAVPAQTYPALPAPPPAVPSGARLLPVVCRRALGPAPYEQYRAAAQPGAFPAIPPRIRTEVHARYVPEYLLPEVPAVPDAEVSEAEEGVPEGDLDVPDPDPFIEKARGDFPDGVPGIATLKKTYGIGQARAQRVRDTLKVLT